MTAIDFRSFFKCLCQLSQMDSLLSLTLLLECFFEKNIRFKESSSLSCGGGMLTLSRRRTMSKSFFKEFNSASEELFLDCPRAQYYYCFLLFIFAKSIRSFFSQIADTFLRRDSTSQLFGAIFCLLNHEMVFRQFRPTSHTSFFTTIIAS
jgi:hypothetical protein